MDRTRSTEGRNRTSHSLEGSTWTPKPRGFSAANLAASEPMRKAAARRGIAEMRLLTQWPQVVGPRLARMTRPVRVRHDRNGHGLGGVLILAVNGPRASEIEVELPQIVERVNAYYGYRAIAGAKLTQTEQPIDPMSAGPRRREGVDAASLPQEKRDALAELTKPIGDDALRDALTRLGANVMARPKSSRERG